MTAEHIYPESKDCNICAAYGMAGFVLTRRTFYILDGRRIERNSLFWLGLEKRIPQFQEMIYLGVPEQFMGSRE